MADLEGDYEHVRGGYADIWDPVCSCDGEMFASECEARAAGKGIVKDNESCIPDELRGRSPT